MCRAVSIATPSEAEDEQTGNDERFSPSLLKQDLHSAILAVARINCIVLYTEYSINR